ncbi:hypothetical protein DXG01_001204 [Tephrocybe rancida]|nr:hypothetical protein DXG01_001204 [Tephrocybe rancida]
MAPRTTVLGTRDRNVAQDEDDTPGLHVGPRKKMYAAQLTSLLYPGSSLIYNGLSRARTDPLTVSSRHSFLTPIDATLQLLTSLLDLCRGLEERIAACQSGDEIQLIAELIQKGAKGARADDTKGMKPAIIDWVTPPNGHLTPPLNRRIKTARGFYHDVTGSLLCPAGLDWNNPE